MKTIDDAFRIPQLENGEKLYHYTSAEGLKGLCTRGFWITERGFLNDSMEFQVATDILFEILDEHMDNKKACESLKKDIQDKVEFLQTPGMAIIDKVSYYGDYILSFCLDYDSPLMWSSYSDYTGYCIAFDFEKLINSFESPQKVYHGQVIYNKKEQKELIINLVKRNFFDLQYFSNLNTWNDFGTLLGEDKDVVIDMLSSDISIFNMFFKLSAFEGEHEYKHEYRMILSSIHDGGGE